MPNDGYYYCLNCHSEITPDYNEHCCFCGSAAVAVSGDYSPEEVETAFDLLNKQQQGLVIVPPCNVGEEIWVIEREDGEAIDVLGCMFLAQSKGCVIATSYINDYDLDETIEYHINKTQDNLDTNLMVYPAEDCYMTREEAEQALKGAADNA